MRACEQTEGVLVRSKEMSLPYNKKLIPIAKELRKSMTKQELFLWSYFLKDYPIRFQRQKVIDNFIVDFYCHKAFLVIEIDGSQHYSENGLAYDDHRTDILSKYNLKVIRFTNTEVDKSFKEVQILRKQCFVHMRSITNF